MVDKKILDSYFLARRLRERSQQSYIAAMTKLVKRLDMLFQLQNLQQVTLDQLLRWRAWELEQGHVSHIGWNSYMRHLRALFGHAVEQKLVDWPENYFKKLFVRQPKKKENAA